MKKILSFILLAGFSVGAFAQSELIISEYVEGWSNNKALEIFNPTDEPIDLYQFRLIRYSNGTYSTPPADQFVANLPDETLEPYQTFVVVIDQRNPDGTGQDAPVWEQLQQRADAFLCPEYEVSYSMYFNGNDAVVLEKYEGEGEYSIQDIFARWGTPAPALAPAVGGSTVEAWTNTFPYFSGLGIAITADHTMIRKSNIETGVIENLDFFDPLAEYDTLSANTFDHLGWHEFDNAPANETPVRTNEKLTWAVSPTATNGTEVVTITATDAEQDVLTFYMDAGNFIYIENIRYEPFSLDPSTGVLSMVDETGLAPALKDTFDITINVTDGYSQLGPLNCKVIVTDNEVGVSSYLQSSLGVYPNPVTDNQFRIESEKGISAVYLTNLVGQLVMKKEYSTPLYQQNLDIDSDLNGVYILNVIYEDRMSESLKLLVK